MKYLRLYKILATFKAYQLGEFLPKYRLSAKFKFVLALLFWVRKRAKAKEGGERLVLALQELGPIWVKLGQMLSTRRDLLPDPIAEQLVKLQDQVAPFDGQIAQQMIEQALGHSIDHYFTDFDITPLASASIAQVHCATLKQSGAKIIIKVLRPEIKPVIDADIEVMYWLSAQLEKYLPDANRLRSAEIVRDYHATLLNEMNLLREADNTSRLRQNFINSDMLYIPYVYRELCRSNVMVEERISGVPISDIAQLKARNVNLKLLAERGVNVFFTQVFRDNFFHADMHPGNIFIDVKEPINPRYIGIDCAIVGELSRDDQRFLAQNFIAFFNRDYQKIASLYVQSAWVPEDTDIVALESAMRAVCEPIFAKPLGEISFAQILFHLFQVARQFNMVIQPQLVLLEKTLFYIEGLGRQLYPQLDLWATAKPFLESWYHEQTSIKHITKQFIDTLPQWHEVLPELPARIKQYEREQKKLVLHIERLTKQLELAKTKQCCAWKVAIIVSIIVTSVMMLLIKLV
ncbi:2-octaprenylphenol hydroxylase [Orbus hercynius]|uniref:2-octaprenylphenol hydroxylase n=1 Tax=Orbus hercynius TaxID=593135 RepID=A0A495RCE8_9GAMM|nr:ubiquinone biosynthesis regulatory protein kinase UbiB [Orbus hercynius]RKS85142.1 2-octaprenylphenol hydroxylase [Orbus hercynius]